MTLTTPEGWQAHSGPYQAAAAETNQSNRAAAATQSAAAAAAVGFVSVFSETSWRLEM